MFYLLAGIEGIVPIVVFNLFLIRVFPETPHFEFRKKEMAVTTLPGLIVVLFALVDISFT